MSDKKKDALVTKGPHELKRAESPFSEIEQMFADFMNRRFLIPSWFPHMKRPEFFADVTTSVDMFEEGTDLVIKAELPGMKKEDITIDLNNDVLTITGEKKSEECTERKDYHRIERSFGSFSRRLRLPVEIKADEAKASITDGVLEIRMPKSEAAKQNTKKIVVT